MFYFWAIAALAVATFVATNDGVEDLASLNFPLESASESADLIWCCKNSLSVTKI